MDKAVGEGIGEGGAEKDVGTAWVPAKRDVARVPRGAQIVATLFNSHWPGHVVSTPYL